MNYLINKIYGTLELNEKYKISKIYSIKNIEKYILVNNITKNIKFIENQLIGGDVSFNTYKIKNDQLNTERAIVNNNEYYYYNVERYMPPNDSNIFIDMVSINKKNYQDDDNKICGSIQIDKTNNHATIISLGKQYRCIKPIDNNVSFKYGDITFQIMLDICKRENIKYINLTDNAHITCGDNNINLDLLKTMTHGMTHYRKYGFKFKNYIDEETYIFNKKLYDTIPTIKKNKLIDLIKSTDSKIKNKVIDILMKFNKNDISVRKFIGILTLDLENIEMCKLAHDLYPILFVKSGYKSYLTDSFYLNL